MKIEIKLLRFAFAAVMLLASACDAFSQGIKKPKATVTGNAGISYEGYGLTTKPGGYSFYSPRRPWNIVRFNFTPTVSIGKFKLPFNFNFSPMRTNFGSVPFGFGRLSGFPKQTIGQWLTNPMNNIGINPSYKWAELKLGTQYLKYSDLSTGDIGAFGYGFKLTPNKFRIQFFRGVNQQAFQPYTGSGTPPPFVGAYKRIITMGQIGLAKEDKYFAGFNIVKANDVVNSIAAPLTAPPFFTPPPAQNVIVSFNTNFKTKKGWHGQTELATTYTNRDARAISPSSLVKDFKPLLKTNVSSYRDHAAQAGFGKRGKGWDLGASMKWLGAGYNAMGYPFVQNDRLEYTVNTKFNAFKKKTNVVARLGQRFGNWSTSTKTTQLLANANVFTQFNQNFNINTSYNNFGFTAPSFGGMKNVGNDLGINPTYTWANKKMSNLISLTYNWSKYVEVTILPALTTTNNTHTAMLLYAPSIFSNPNLSPDFSIMYFTNHSSTPTDLKIISASSNLNWNIPERKLSVRGQILFNRTSINSFSPSNNLVATIGTDIRLSKKLSFNASLTANGQKYGDELTPPPQLLGATYLESSCRASVQYRFGK